MDVERDEVNIVTVRGAFMIDPQTGYIKLGDFSETSDKEVGDALEKLKAQGMKRLVFDLRDNPGGPLDQAIRIANRFLPRGDMIVYTRGRVPNADQDYRGTDDPDFTRADAGADQPQQRQRVGDRQRLAAGSRSRARRRRDDVRQGAGAVGLQDQRRGRPRADHRPLLHAERPHDPASVGQRVRRVPHLHAARSDGQP